MNTITKLCVCWAFSSYIINNCVHIHTLSQENQILYKYNTFANQVKLLIYFSKICFLTFLSWILPWYVFDTSRICCRSRICQKKHCQKKHLRCIEPNIGVSDMYPARAWFLLRSKDAQDISRFSFHLHTLDMLLFFIGS